HTRPAETRGANPPRPRGAPEAPPIGRPAAVAPAPSSHPAPAPAAASQRGELKDNLPSLITAFYLSGQTGELGVQRGKVKKVIYFHRGQPVFAMSNLLNERFGQFLRRVGKIRPEQLQEVLAAVQASRRRTGDVLLERGLLKDTERLYFVGQHM